MEVSLMARQSAGPKPDQFPVRHLDPCSLRRIPSRSGRVSFEPTTAAWWKGAVHAAPAAIRSELSLVDQKSQNQTKLVDPVRLFVGLPLDAVSDRNTVNHAKAIAAGLRALKLLGAHGVDLPVSWAVVQPDSPDRFDWTAYLSIAAAARDAGLRLRISLNLHTLPQWIKRVVKANPDLLFTDRSGRRFTGPLSLAADDLPVLDNTTPMKAFENFFISFRSAFASLMGTTITDVTVGLGPDGELRYPSFPSDKPRDFAGVGEFQCYDKYMLDSLRKHAEASGNPLWGLGGPHDAPQYTQFPDSGSFFKDHGGSWETPYGNFFLSWYSSLLVNHADNLLSVAHQVFGEMPVTISGKVPLLHFWHNTRSRPALLTAGFYHSDGRNGFDAVAEVFGRNSCTMILPGMNLAEQEQRQGVGSRPETLLKEILEACKRHGVAVSGENSPLVGAGAAGFKRIKESLLEPSVVSFTYQRMGADFFSPEHWPRFTEFVRSLAVPELAADDVLGVAGERVSLPMAVTPAKEREMQAV